MSLSERRCANKNSDERDVHLKEMETDYEQYGEHKMKEVKSKNIMIIGRTRSGKTTIKSMLLDPTKIPDDLALKSGTRDPLIGSFYIEDMDATLNIIDTPGLFERGSESDSIRNNDAILKTIEKCANMEITSFHMICFCAALTAGINGQDVEAMELFMQFLGDEISKNSCLIITHCEGKNEEQRRKLINELESDVFFKQIRPYFKLGVFFSGAVNRDNYNKGSDVILDEYVIICEYRKKLIQAFTNDIKPFPITETKISEIRRAKQSETDAQNKLQNAENLSKQYENDNTDLQSRYIQQQVLIKDLQQKCKINEQTIDHADIRSRENERTINDLREQCREYRRTNDDLRKICAEEKRSTEYFQRRIKEYEEMVEELSRSSPWKVRELSEKYPNCFRQKK